MLRLAARVASALALASTLALAVTTPALADPPQPAATDLVGVGTGTTEQLFNQFSTDYNASLAAAGDTASPRLYSWDSTGSASITTKAGATTIARPSNSSAGIAALTGTTSSTVDFSRSDRAPQVDDLTTTLFVVMAKDAVSWAAPTGGNAPAGLTSSQLSSIYGCTITNWRQINPALPDAAIRPILPARGTDTRRTFLQALGRWGQVDAAGPCVLDVDRANQGTDAILHDPNAIVPYSVGHYVGQAFGGHTRPGDEPGVLVPRAIDGIPAVDQVNRRINLPFVTSAFGHILYNTVRSSDWYSTDAHGNALRAVFGPSGWICRSNGGAPAVRSYGFLTLPPGACGAVVHI